MEQHPVPQPISSYEFRLVGDMTIKQFAKLASGIILALIVYGINPPSLIKWFLIFLFAGLGAAMAFVPFEGRPIDVWIIAFFKRIYSPTQYIWRSGKASPSSQQPTSVASTPPASPPTTPPPPPPPPKIRDLSALYQTPFFEGKRVSAKFSPKVVIPATPSLPNLIVGYIHDAQGKIVEGAILEIRDAAGNPVRALKSNKLGQFLIATPLPNGKYEIETEKEDYLFDIIRVELIGTIVPPIEIVSK